MALTLNLTGSKALVRGERTSLVLTVKEPDGSPRPLAGHTFVLAARPDFGHEMLWCALDETDGVTLGGELGTISILFPEISVAGGERGSLGVWTGALRDPDGVLVFQVMGALELKPTAIE